MTRTATIGVLVLLQGLGCSNQTSGGLFQGPFSIGGLERPSAGPLFFTTSLGWAVELDAAKIDLGPFYFNIDPPNTSQFRSGVVISESLQQVTVDALNPVLLAVAGGIRGQTGTAVAVEIGLFPPDSTITDPDVGGPAGNATAYLTGLATMAGQQVPFKGWVVIDANLASTDTPLPWLQRVNGAVCDLDFAASNQPLTLRVDPTSWFDGADFSSLLPPGAADGGTDAGPGGPYGWADVSNFEASVLNQIQATTGVYAFELTNGQ